VKSTIFGQVSINNPVLAKNYRTDWKEERKGRMEYFEKISKIGPQTQQYWTLLEAK